MLIADGLDVGSERERDVCDEIRERMSLKCWSSHMENGVLSEGLGKNAIRLGCGGARKKDQELSFGHTKFKMPIRQPNKDILGS